MNVDTTNKDSICDSLKKLSEDKCSNLYKYSKEKYAALDHYVNTPNELKIANCLKTIELMAKFNCNVVKPT